MNKNLCEDVRLLLSLYIDDMLSEKEMTMVREHLEICDSCKDEYALLKGIMEKTMELPQLEASAGFAASLHEKLKETAAAMAADGEFSERKKLGVVKRWRIYPAALAGAAAIVLSVFALSNLPDAGMFIKNNTLETEMPSAAPTYTAPARESFLPQQEEAELTPAPVASATQKPEKKAEKILYETNDSSKVIMSAETIEPAMESGETGTNSHSVEMKKVAEPDAQESTADSAGANVPMTAALDAGEENGDVNQFKSAVTESDAATEETATESSALRAAVSGGGGGGASSAIAVRKTVVFNFDENGIELAEELLSGLVTENGGYVIPAGKFDEYREKLMALDGYLSCNETGDIDGECLIVLQN